MISAAIMEAATEVFLTCGFDDASMEAIAARAGITKVTLYKRFADKRSLLRAVLQERRLRWDSSMPRASGVEARLKHYASMILVQSVSAEVRAFNALAARAWPTAYDMREREEVVGYDDLLRRLEHEILQGAGELGVESANAAAVAAALMAMISGWFDHRVPDPDRDAIEAEEFASKAVELLIHGKAAW